MNIPFTEACNIIDNNKIKRVYCIEDFKEKDYGKPKGKGINRTSIALLECGDYASASPLTPMIFIREDEISRIVSSSKEIIFSFNDGMKYRIVFS